MRKKTDPFPGTLTRSEKGCHPYILTSEQEAWLCKWFPEVENGRLMKLSGMSHGTLHRFARALKLTKSEEGMRKINKRQAAKAKRICEENGYYDSLRGRRPSEACMQAVKKKWQEIREGKREYEHYLVKMKRETPRKYRACMKRWGKARKELYRKESMRLAYGLTRKTKFRQVVSRPYTRSQVGHRHNALKRGYSYMEDCTEGSGERYNIYWDSETQRSERFEANLIKDGFRVMKWKED